jgi:cell division septum initiation protein DivIVA
MTVTFRGDERLTPDLVQSITFPTARLGRRGFDEERAREFCAQVEREPVMLLNEKAGLWEEVERLRRRIIGDEGAVIPGYRPEDAHLQAVRVLSKAQQTADKYVADAQQYSRQLAEDARRRRDEVLAEARANAERVLSGAHIQASQAATMAVAGAGEEPPGSPGRSEAQAELAYLRTFSDVYRTHLRAYLEALLRNVEEWETSERESLAGTRSMLPRMD